MTRRIVRPTKQVEVGKPTKTLKRRGKTVLYCLEEDYAVNVWLYHAKNVKVVPVSRDVLAAMANLPEKRSDDE